MIKRFLERIGLTNRVQDQVVTSDTLEQQALEEFNPPLIYTVPSSKIETRHAGVIFWCGYEVEDPNYYAGYEKHKHEVDFHQEQIIRRDGRIFHEYICLEKNKLLEHEIEKL